MVILIADPSMLPVPRSTLHHAIGGDIAVQEDPKSTLWAVSTIEELLKLLHLARAREAVGWVGFSVGGPLKTQASLRFVNSVFSESTDVYIIMFEGTWTVGAETADLGFIVLGDHIFNLNISSCFYNFRDKFKFIGPSDYTDRTPLPNLTKLLGVKSPEYYCFQATEWKLYTLLKNSTIPREVRILSALITLFPYIIPHLSKHVSVKDSYGSESASGEYSRDVEGEQLSLLAIYLLAPAYSNVERLADQVARRTKAAAAQRGIKHLDKERTKDLLTSIQWKGGDIPPIVYKALGMVVCVTKDLEYNPEARIADLADIGVLINKKVISVPDGSLLEQARLVYRGYHSTSIRFILPVLPLITSVGVYETFRVEIAAFNNVKNVVENSPYMGLRDFYPTAYHIANFPKLTYCGLKYYGLSLTDEKEKKMFSEYKVAKIRTRIHSSSEREVVDLIVHALPSPSLSALTSFMKHLTLERARSLMAGRPSTEVAQILDNLRGDENRGAWAEAMIAQENAEYQRILIQEALTQYKVILAQRYDIERKRADPMTDVEARKRALNSINTWKAGILKMLDDLTPWEDSLPDALRYTQGHIRRTVVGQLRQVLEVIKAGADILMEN